MKNFYSTLVSKSQFILQFLAYLICFFSYANVSLDPDTPKEVSEILGGHSDYINCLTFNANGDSLEVKQDNQKNTFDTTTSFSGYLEKGLERSDPKLQTVLNSVLATSYGPGGPILIIKSSSRPFSSYAAEILLAEGLNEFATSDISVISPELLSTYDVIIIGEIPLTEEQVTMLSNWAGAGGTLIAFRPDVKLAPLMGLTVAGGTLNDKYILINTSSGPGKGLVSQTIQYHSAADLYNLNGATSLATLYSGVNTATTNPAVSINNVGVNGGKAVAFTYDLARSIVYTRQGNPEWAGQERDGQPGPIRSNDIFFPDWVDLNKVAIPQADEQQRLLANIIVQNSRKPMPRFWYLPRGLKAAVVMTGDDHANNGTTARFNQYLQLSEDNSAAAVADWRAIRGTSYIFLNTPITNAEAKSFEDQGFEIALHLDTGCSSFTPSSFDNDLTNQLAEFKFRFPSITAPTTNRTHCIAYSDWATSPKLGSGKGIRLDANYYYWPESWVQNRPGMFTGSAMPMRFADLDGTIIDSYQLVTQMTDESGQNFPFTIDQLLDKALGPEGYYGMFCANMHTDADFSDGSDKIIASAKARNIPVISAKQVLTWLDGRNGSSFGSIGWNENKLNFSISVASGAHKLEGMVPAILGSIRIVGLTVNGEPATYRIETIKGIEYAFFSAINGEFVATYDVNTPPAVSITAPANNATFTAPATIVINATASDTDGTIAKVEFFQGTTKLGEDLSSPYSFSWSNAPAGTYSLTARASDDKTATTNSAAVNVTVNPDPGGFGCPCTVFEPTTGPTNQLYTDGQAVQLGMKFRSSENGFVSGVRFFKQAGNTGTHIGQLYSRTGSLLAQATFTNETASGWQEVAFSSPVAVTANTTYVISYHSGSGFYSASNPFFNSATVKTPLTGLQSGTDGPNGVYRYSGTPAFPNQNYQSSNYWVDVVFNTSSATNTPPAVAITAPANNATFIAPATIVINATASDTDGTIAKVEFFQGTTKLGEDLSSPYSFSWNNAAAGTYSLTARATDDKAAVTTSAAVNVTVSDSTNTPPTVAITAPANNATFIAPATIVVEATASDTDGTISKVEFFQGTTKLGEDLSSPYSFSWNNAAAGTYSLTARATDDKAAVTTSAAVNVTVSDPTNTPPTVAITAPGNNATFTAPASIVINATASDTDGTITKVEFFQGTTKLGEDLSSPYSFSWSNAPAGTYSLTARASDDKTATTNSAAVNVTVNPDPGGFGCPCTVFEPTTGPTNQLYTDGQAVQLGMKFRSSENGFVSGVRFFKQAGNTGTHIGQLYSRTGSLLAQATFTNETASGWQEVAFSSPVAVTANTTYVISYHSSSGFYSASNPFFNSATVKTPLTGLQSGTDGPNGVYRYSGTPAFPNQNYQSSNYWVDVVFNTSSATNTPPAVAITAPANNATFIAPATIVINATASDTDGTIAKVEFFQGTTKLGEDLSSPYSFSWNNAAAGTYSLTARATDDKAAVTTSAAVSVTVSNPTNTPPTVAITAPANNATFIAPATIVVEATASDTDGTISKVEFFQGTTKLGEDLSSPYSFSWNNAAAGTYSLTARATDDKAAVTTSAAVSVTVSNPTNTPPTVAITAPANNATFIAPATIVINATASDTDGTIAKVEFFQGTTKLGEDLSSPYSFSWNNAAAGTYSLTARATDDKAAVTTSAAVNVTVSDPTNTPPTVAITAPGNNATFTAPASIVINATASDTDGTITKVEFFQGTTKLGEDLSSPYSFSWSNASAGTYSLTARATDDKAAVTISTAVNVTVSDSTNTPPTVSITAPANNAAFIAPATIVIDATASDTDGTISKVEFFQGTTKLGEDLSSPYSFSWSNAAAGTYSLTARATDDKAAVTISTAVNVTVSDPTNTPPTVSITAPANNAAFIAPATIVIDATASDTDGTITKVEFFQGTTKLGEDLSSPYSFSWSNSAAGTYSLTARATDDKAAVTTSAVVSVTVNPDPGGFGCPCTVFEPTAGPTNQLWNDGQALQLGMKFRSSVNGFVTGVRFFKQAGNTGTHIGQLYSRTGSLLAQATFTNETASGWQEVALSSPVAINANTTYVISYHSSSGFYSASNPFFNSATVKTPLTGLQSGTDGPNGVYRYSGTPAFPNQNYQSGNYWVDVVFDTSNPLKTTATSVVSSVKTSVSQSSDPQPKDVLKVYPNPFSEIAYIDFVLQNGGEYVINLYDGKGSFVALLKKEQTQAGQKNLIEIDGRGLPSGIYLVRLQSQKGTQTFRIAINR